jgi:hypothetical protein
MVRHALSFERNLKCGPCLSGSSSTLLHHRPLRTVRAGFPRIQLKPFKAPSREPASSLVNQGYEFACGNLDEPSQGSLTRRSLHQRVG